MPVLTHESKINYKELGEEDKRHRNEIPEKNKSKNHNGQSKKHNIQGNMQVKPMRTIIEERQIRYFGRVGRLNKGSIRRAQED